MRDSPEDVTKKVRTMPTDPARVRRTDPGTPEKCPVWSLHQVYSNQDTRDWVVKGCTSAGIGCLECKQPVIDAVNGELQPIRERAARLRGRPDARALDHPGRVREGFRPRGRDDARRARGHGPQLQLRVMPAQVLERR